MKSDPALIGLPAFPSKVLVEIEKQNDFFTEGPEGMELLDYFAAKAMQAIRTNPNFAAAWPDSQNPYAAVAVDAYFQASEMMKERANYFNKTQKP